MIKTTSTVLKDVITVNNAFDLIFTDKELTEKEKKDIEYNCSYLWTNEIERELYLMAKRILRKEKNKKIINFIKNMLTFWANDLY